MAFRALQTCRRAVPCSLLVAVALCAAAVAHSAVAANAAEPLVFWVACIDATAATPCGIYSQPLNKPGANATVVYMPDSYVNDVSRLAVGDDYLCVRLIPVQQVTCTVHAVFAAQA